MHNRMPRMRDGTLRTDYLLPFTHIDQNALWRFEYILLCERRRAYPQAGRQRGSALWREDSDGKPCSGVRGDQQVSTERWAKSALRTLHGGCFHEMRPLDIAKER